MRLSEQRPEMPWAAQASLRTTCFRLSGASHFNSSSIPAAKGTMRNLDDFAPKSRLAL